MKKNSNSKPFDILSRDYRRYDLTNPDNYEADYPDGDFRDNVGKLLETPDAEHMAGVFVRGNFRSERQLNAAIRLYRRHVKFNDSEHQMMLICKIFGGAALNGVSRLEALFGATNLIASDMYRVARGMPKRGKGEEEKILKGGDGRGSDFRHSEKLPSGIEG